MTESNCIPSPTNSLVTPMLTDLYQITMAYAYWKTNRHTHSAVFEVFFRKNPFGGEYTIFCGLDEVLKFLANFRFSPSDLDFLRQTPALKDCDPEFFDEYLTNLDCSEVSVEAVQEGSLVFPRMPLLVISGPLGITQLLETTILTLVNFPSLVATNAARMVVAANSSYGNEGSAFLRKVPKCVEFGLRRAQGVDGGFSASKYCIIGGFDASSNVLAGKLLGIPISGTHAHAFVQSHSSLDDCRGLKLKPKGSSEEIELLDIVLKYREEFGNGWSNTNDGELAAFVAYAVSFPETFLCLIDTYDVLRSGLRNFIMVALSLNDCGYIPKGVRLDSGDLSFFSLEASKEFSEIADRFDRPFMRELDIVASNDINENVLHSLNKQGHGITIFGIGTNLVTCQAQPALGCVYKLVQINDKPRMKLSQDIEKVLIPGRKVAYRLFGKSGLPLLDLLVGKDNNDEIPIVGSSILCRHPFIEQKRCLVRPTIVKKLHTIVFDKENGVVIELPNIHETKQVSQKNE